MKKYLDYKAEKPKFKEWQSFAFLAPRITFPPILLWDFCKWGVNKIAGEAMGRQILPAQTEKIKQKIIRKLASHAPIDEIGDERFAIQRPDVFTHDDAKLDTLEIQPKVQQNIEHQKYIVNFLGNSGAYELIIDEMKADAENLSANVVGFNYRGVMNSTGKPKSKKDLVVDGISQVQRLLDNGVLPQNITLKGLSLGGGISSLVAAYFHKNKQPINIFNDRSFSSISNYAVGHIRTLGGNHTGHRESAFGIILGWIAKPFIKIILSLLKWEINAGDAFKAIPEDFRDYVVVRSPKNKRTREILDDAKICHYASIHITLKDERRAKKAQVIEVSNSQHMSPDVINENLVALKAKNKARKLLPAKGVNGHYLKLKDLGNSIGESGSHLFEDFVQRPHANLAR